MARTKAQDYESKRAAILSKAAYLFGEKGFAGASISDISKACNISKSLIYHYYPAKEDILYGVMQDHMDDLTKTISDGKLIATDAKQELHNLTQDLLVRYAGAEDSQKVLLYELNNLAENHRKDIVTKQRAIINRFEQVYIRIDQSLANNPSLLRTKTMLFFGSINWIHTWYNKSGEISRDTLAKLAVENTIGAI